MTDSHDDSTDELFGLASALAIGATVPFLDRYPQIKSRIPEQAQGFLETWDETLTAAILYATILVAMEQGDQETAKRIHEAIQDRVNSGKPRLEQTVNACARFLEDGQKLVAPDLHANTVQENTESFQFLLGHWVLATSFGVPILPSEVEPVRALGLLTAQAASAIYQSCQTNR